MGRSTSWRCRKTGGWELTQVRIMTTKLFNIAFQFRKPSGSRFWNRVLWRSMPPWCQVHQRRAQQSGGDDGDGRVYGVFFGYCDDDNDKQEFAKRWFFKRIGSQARRTPMRVSGILARVASNSISGKPMRSQRWPLSLFCLPDDDDDHDDDKNHHHHYLSWSKVFTPHPCDTVGQQRCEGTPCGDNKSGERWFMMMITIMIRSWWSWSWWRWWCWHNIIMVMIYI